MTYLELKALEMPTLFALLEKQIRLCYELTPDQFVQGGPLPPPALFVIGDFIISARFPGMLLEFPDRPMTMREHNDLHARYNELLYAVERKFPGEFRHETALRYIREAEACALAQCSETESKVFIGDPPGRCQGLGSSTPCPTNPPTPTDPGR